VLELFDHNFSIFQKYSTIVILNLSVLLEKSSLAKQIFKNDLNIKVKKLYLQQEVKLKNEILPDHEICYNQ